jgi:hypothetical protein
MIEKARRKLGLSRSWTDPPRRRLRVGRAPATQARWRAVRFLMPDSSGPVFTRRNRTTFQPALTDMITVVGVKVDELLLTAADVAALLAVPRSSV